jgi:hypothetical protein
MKKRIRDFDIFSLSFLDVISCGFGAIVLLVLISNNADAPSSDDSSIAQLLLSQVLQMETDVDAMSHELEAAKQARQTKQLLLDRLKQTVADTAGELQASQSDSSEVSDDLKGLALVQSSLKRASVSQATAEVRDTEVGGIPVDSDYVVFIIDTSGSMKAIWNRVVAEVEHVIEIHPQIKGFQILNDNGAHLISAYEGKWIPDTPRRRKNAVELFRTWNSASNSSPVEGLEVALRRYAKPNISVSIYIFGDDYSGSSYDPVINSLVNLNTNRITGKPLAKIHAVGFHSQHSTERFPILMREVTRRNGGSFVALPM